MTHDRPQRSNLGLNSVSPLRCVFLALNFTPAPGEGQHVSEKLKVCKVHQNSQSYYGIGGHHVRAKSKIVI